MEQESKADGYFGFRFFREGPGRSRVVLGLWCLSVLFLFSSRGAGYFYGKELTIGDKYITNGAPSFYATMDAAGYSDWIWYGPSADHEEGYHEILSGEWGAAVSMNDQPATWLTQLFSFPNWPTYCDFRYGGICRSWQDPNDNPAPLYDTGQSVIYNDKLEVTIDYEVVDLAFRDPNYYLDRSPICYLDSQTGQPRLVYSDRYCFLQTYTFRNIDPNLQPVTDLEFYVFLHSHGADEYGPYVNSTYCELAPEDPLADYTPYNPVHQVGSFRYDLTQWNGPAFDYANHVDFVSVSSTVEPNWIDNDIFRGGHSYNVYKPPLGTHIHIEQRNLNGVAAIYGDEVGGAMGWDMGTLNPNQTVSRTIAYMFGPKQEPTALLELTKTILDPNDCFGVGDPVTFRIQWENKGADPITDAVLVDYLPSDLTYPVSYGLDPNMVLWSSDPNYVESNRTYTWDLGTIAGYEVGYVDFQVFVDGTAEPGLPTVNQAELYTSVGDVSAQCAVPVCCFDSYGIIYVDQRATGENNGTSWQDAYTDLYRALARADAGCGSEIRVAYGTYDPGRKTEDKFIIPAGVTVLGGYRGGTVSPDNRNPRQYETILTGAAETNRNATIVQMGDESLLGGFTVTSAGSTEGPSYCVYGSDVDFTLEQCTVKDSDWYGVRASNGNVTIRWCEIKQCIDDAIRHDGYGKTLNIDNSWIMKNLAQGIYCANSTPYVRNSVITESDLSEAGNAGILIFNPSTMPILHNCTFAHNRSEGVVLSGDPNDYPDVQNCIMWYNNAGGDGRQFAGFTKQHIYHSCIYDPNDPLGENLLPDANYNLTADPNMVYIDPNNVRISTASPCIDAGNRQMTYSGQVDMDYRTRVLGDYVDMGAYEVDPYCQSDSHELDWNHDGLFNYHEFTAFSAAWLSHDPNDPAIVDPNHPDHDYYTDPNSLGYVTPVQQAAWNPLCNLEAAGSSIYLVDLADLEAFVFDVPWLWRACWLTDSSLLEMSSGGDEMLMMSGDFMAPDGMQTLELAAQPELSVEDQIAQLEDSLVFLARLWLEEPDIQQQISPEDWQEFMGAVYQSLLDLQTQAIQLE